MDQAAEPQRQPQAGAPPAGAATPARGRLVRRTDNRLLAGVAGGIADALGIHPVLVRIAFVVPTAFGGLGAWLYVLGWLLLPPPPPTSRQARRAVGVGAGVGRRPRWIPRGSHRAFQAIGRHLWATAWVWPLAAVAAITVGTSPLVRDRWGRPTSLQLGLVVFGLGGLIVALGPVRAVLVLTLAAIVGLLAAWALVLPRRLAPPLPPRRWTASATGTGWN